jgi:hypothetical protein
MKARTAAVLALLDCVRRLIPLQQKLKYSLAQATQDKLAFHRPLLPRQHAQLGTRNAENIRTSVLLVTEKGRQTDLPEMVFLHTEEENAHN